LEALYKKNSNSLLKFTGLEKLDKMTDPNSKNLEIDGRADDWKLQTAFINDLTETLSVK
jgi:hypothetical protein